MKGLVVNCGSSSIKFKLIDVDNYSTIFEARAEHLNSTAATVSITTYQGTYRLPRNYDVPTLDHKTALQEIINYLASSSVISSLDEISFVGHRVVHGGTFFSEPHIITDEVLEKIDECTDLAPLHNPVSIIGIESCQKLLPKVPQVAVFDTSFHQTMPEENYRYAIPFSKDIIRKYGFHGTSYSYLTKQLSSLIGKDNISAIMAHVGQGVSVCAVKKGISTDTSMGFSPSSGCIMGTRSGAIDQTTIQYLCNNYDYTVDQAIDIFNKKSGLLALCGTNNMIQVLEGVNKNKEKYVKAFNMFCMSIAKHISNCILSGLREPVQQIVFSGGIGENSHLVRKTIIDMLSPLIQNIKLDDNANRNNAQVISAANSAVTVYVIPTDEELEIAIASSELI